MDLRESERTNTRVTERKKWKPLRFKSYLLRRHKIIGKTAYLLRIRSIMSVPVRSGKKDAVGRIGEMTKLSKHETLGTGLGGSDEGRRQ